jgi:hypothetical protein
MRILLVIAALGIGAAGVHAATIPSFAPVGVPAIADPPQDGENGSNAPASGSTQNGSDPFAWLNIHQRPVAGFSSGGSSFAGKSRGSGRHSGGAGRSSSGRSGSGHKGGANKGGHQGSPPKGR